MIGKTISVVKKKLPSNTAVKIKLRKANEQIGQLTKMVMNSKARRERLEKEKRDAKNGIAEESDIENSVEVNGANSREK